MRVLLDTNIVLDYILKRSPFFEHKSNYETHPHLQLLGYILRVWAIDIKQKRKFNFIKLDMQIVIKLRKFAERQEKEYKAL